LYDNPNDGLQKLACTLAGILGKDLRTQLKRRAITEIPEKYVASYPLREITRLLSGPLDSSGRLTDLVWWWAELGFDTKVSQQLKPQWRGVYGYEHSSLATFQRAKELGLRVFYDLPAPETRFFQEIQAREFDAFPGLKNSYQSHVAKHETTRTERRHTEWAASDLVIVNSEFTKKSFLQAGLPEKPIAVVPYGAPPVITSLSTIPKKDAPLRLLWAGTFSIRKGAHYLLKAWKDSHLGRHAILRIHGAITLPDDLLNPLPEGIEIAGSIPRDQLMKAYEEADALIFPTLCDGFGMVVTEAFACGLPVITTSSAGAADLVRNQENGLLIEPGSADAISGAINWCLENRSALATMREKALHSAANWQWSDYRAKLASEVKRHLS
ncbi:MAG: glycosyltransferase family 4 protein, partial [Chthoniobacterales bacterium]